ncbi:MAG: alpha/beta hydrolase [Acidimicrobiia bacterium]
MERIELHGTDGIRLAADVVGDPAAPPAVLLHGGGQTRYAWGSTAQVLAERGWRAYRVDLRGHGESEWSPDGRYGIDRFAGDIVEITGQVGAVAPPVMIGASLGGISSLLAIGEATTPIARGLVLVDVAPRTEPEGVKRIGDFMGANLESGFGSLEEVADAVAAYNPHRPRPTDLSGLKKNVRLREDGRWVWHWDPAFMRGIESTQDETRASDLINHERLEAAARRLTVPTLLVRGRMSDLLSEEGAREMLALAPHAEYADVAGAGHMVAGDRNDLFNDAIVGFLDRLPPV